MEKAQDEMKTNSFEEEIAKRTEELMNSMDEAHMLGEIMILFAKAIGTSTELAEKLGLDDEMYQTSIRVTVAIRKMLTPYLSRYKLNISEDETGVYAIKLDGN